MRGGHHSKGQRARKAAQTLHEVRSAPDLLHYEGILSTHEVAEVFSPAKSTVYSANKRAGRVVR